MAHPDGELAQPSESTWASPPLTTTPSTSRETGTVHHVMQLYSMKDREKEARIVRRAEAAGCKAIFLTAGNPVLGVRYNKWRNGFQPPAHLGYPMVEKTPERVQQESHDDGFASFILDSHAWGKEIPWLRGCSYARGCRDGD